MSKPTGPTGTAICAAAQLQKRVDELEDTIDIIAALCERYRVEVEFWRDLYFKRLDKKHHGKPA